MRLRDIGTDDLVIAGTQVTTDGDVGATSYAALQASLAGEAD